ncbi:MAG: transglycosylase SLT domain-containing protein [Pseudomonadota bacterium]
MQRLREAINEIAKFGSTIIFALIAAANAAYSSANDCDLASRFASQKTGVPLDVLLAVARTETGRSVDEQFLPWPWAINVNGAGFWFESKSDAVDFAQKQLDSGLTNIDLGCFQINLRWHSNQFSSIKEMLDPLTNALYAADYLKRMFELRKDWLSAVGAYHSKTPAHAENYIFRYSKVYTDLHQTLTVPAPLPLKRRSAPFLRGVAGKNAAGSLVPKSGRLTNETFIQF